MKSNNKHHTSFLLAENPRVLSFIDYQLVYESNRNGMYIKSINFLHNGMFLKKVYLKSSILCDSETNLELIICKILFPEFNQKAKIPKGNHKSETKPDEQARFQAANDLFSNLGI
jgi:hypothetical protein